MWHSVQRLCFSLPVLVLWLLVVTPSGVFASSSAGVVQMEIFPSVQEHVHGSTIVELPNGDLLAAWFQGSGERWADDVRIMGARLKKGEDRWSKPFLMADTPGFPDINPILFMDGQKRLWLMWYTVIANQWETSLLKYRISEDYVPGGMGFQPMNHRQDADATKSRGQDARDTQGQDALATGAPKWAWQDVLHVKPGDPAERGIQPNDRFVKSVERQIQEYATYIKEGLYASQPAQGVITAGLWKAWGARMLSKARGEDMARKGQLQSPGGLSKEADLGYPYFQRMGWQTKNKAVLVEGRRLIVPLYSDGFSFSLMALTDDSGQTWRFSEPLVGAGNIQPSIAIRADGTLVAYMRDNGPAPKRLHISSSKDQGLTWSPVRDSELPNPGSGADIVTLGNGHWVLAYNDTERGRESLAVSLSTDEGKTWSHTRHLESGSSEKSSPSGAYPSIIQSADDSLHVVYSFHGTSKTIKHARFTEAWLQGQ
jgi:predicted neuraminidase